MTTGRPAERTDSARAYRPGTLRIDEERCSECGLCSLIAPNILTDRPIPVAGHTLEAMAQCPVGAIVWNDEESGDRCPESGS